MHQLKYFEAAVRLGSLVAAAAACHVSQPALSVQIRLLEEELGTKLLLRRARGVFPTSAGEQVARIARRVLTDLHELSNDVRRQNARPAATFRMGVQPFIATELLPHALSTLKPGHGRLILKELSQTRLIDAVLSDEVDAAVMTMPGRVPSCVEVIPLLDACYALFCPEQHPLALRRTVGLQDLLIHPLAVFKDSAEIERKLLTLAREKDLELQVCFTSDQAISVFELIAAGLGIGVLPSCFAARAHRRPVRMIPLRETDLTLSVVAIHKSNKPIPDLAKALFTHLTHEGINSSQRGPGKVSRRMSPMPHEPKGASYQEEY